MNQDKLTPMEEVYRIALVKQKKDRIYYNSLNEAHRITTLLARDEKLSRETRSAWVRKLISELAEMEWAVVTKEEGRRIQ